MTLYFVLSLHNRASVLRSFSGVDASQLTLNKDDVVTVLEQLDSGWWRGIRMCNEVLIKIGELNGKIGHFPGQFVKIIEKVEEQVPVVAAKEIPPATAIKVVIEPKEKQPPVEEKEKEPPKPTAEQLEEAKRIVVEQVKAAASTLRILQDINTARVLLLFSFSIIVIGKNIGYQFLE